MLHLVVFVQLERGLHGLEPVTVATFPTKKFSDEYFAGLEDSQYVYSLLFNGLSIVSSVFMYGYFVFTLFGFSIM